MKGGSKSKPLPNYQLPINRLYIELKPANETRFVRQFEVSNVHYYIIILY